MVLGQGLQEPLVLDLPLHPGTFPDAHDFMEVAVGGELHVPVGISKSKATACPIPVFERCLGEFPDVEDAGSRLVANDAPRPGALDSVGLDYLGVEIGPVETTGVGSQPFAMLVGMFLGTAR